MFRKFVNTPDGPVDVTTSYDYADQAPEEPPISMIHAGCGGAVEYDAHSERYYVDCDGDDFSLNYICRKCDDAFRDRGEWLKDGI